MVLTDDNFATIVAAVEAGRRVYDNIRKFIFYIFAHATPEVVPFLVFALSGGAVPLPLTVLQLLAFDVGTETLPALALGREPAEPGLMRPAAARPHRGRRPRGPAAARLAVPRPRSAPRSPWPASSTCCCSAGWQPGRPDRPGHPAAPRLSAGHDHDLPRAGRRPGRYGVRRAVPSAPRCARSACFSNRLLLWGIAFELALAAVLIYAPPFQALLGTAALTPDMLAFVAPFPLIVWGADELRRWLLRRRSGR